MQQKEAQNNAIEQQSSLTVQLVKDLMELLVNQNLEVRHGTLSAILQYTPTADTRLMFKNTELILLLRKYVFQPKLATICLSSLIHFGTEPEFLPEYFKLIEPLILQMKEWKDIQLYLSLLLILNISKDEEVIAKIIGQQEKRGYLIEVLYGIFEHEIKYKWVVVGIFVNLTSIERGRKFMVQDKLYTRFVQHLVSYDQRLRQASLKIIRNCSFQWQLQEFSSQILKPQLNLINTLGKLMAYLIHNKSLVNDPKLLEQVVKQYFNKVEIQHFDKQFKLSEKAKAIDQLQLAIDIVLILSNSDFKTKGLGINTQSFKFLLNCLKWTEIKEETKDKLEALEIFGF